MLYHKKIILPIVALTFLLPVSCKKNENIFDFSGEVVEYVDCTMNMTSITEMDFGYVVALSKPDSIGRDYTDINNKAIVHHNCVIIYRTKARYYDGDSISGEMWLDDRYSKAYCQIHVDYDLPEGVCYSLD